MDIGVYKLCFIGVPNDLALKILDEYTDTKFADDYFDYFVESRENTFAKVGTAYYIKTIELDKIGCKIIIVLVSSDTHFFGIRRFHYNGAFGVIFMYDKGESDSLKSMGQLISEAKQIIGNDGKYALVGVDSEKGLITTEQGQQLAKETLARFFEIKEEGKITFAEIVKNLVRECLVKD